MNVVPRKRSSDPLKVNLSSPTSQPIVLCASGPTKRFNMICSARTTCGPTPGGGSYSKFWQNLAESS